MAAAGCRGFLSQPDFWDTEGDAPILKFNTNDWLQNHTDEAIAHANGWLASMGIEPSRLDFDTTPLSSEGARIFRADANRTYRSEPNRNLMVKLLSFSQTKFGDYQQSLGYVAGLLLLFFDPATVFKVLTVLNDSPKFLPGYWRGEATACAVDGYVCLNLLRGPLKTKLLSLGLLPETFVQKWFAGVCIHHLPYSLLFLFLDRFFASGNRYLFQFFLAFFDEFEQDLMGAASNPEANALIRFETAPEPRLRQAVEAASGPKYEAVVRALDIHEARIRGFEDNLSRRLQGANEGMWQKRDDEITFSDEED
uniref:Rab-GAP TBC domain-containing protein n=1 Tax=Zooxanthella nutricula TaxID=1333877 RepID=A0A7S2Q973_9DINO